MNRRVWLWIIILAAAFAAGGSVLWKKSDRPLLSGAGDMPQNNVTISVWVFSKGWDGLLAEFQKKHPQIAIDLRSFRSADQLYNELLASISANAAPQLAEIQSFYGVPELAMSGGVSALNDQDGLAQAGFLPAFAEPFRYEGRLWAVPIGGSVPMLYYREELLGRIGLPAKGFRRWAEVERAASLPLKEGSLHPPDRWGLAVDKELPWYAQNMSGGTVSGPTFELWRRWVQAARIMTPLNHPLAASDFINGKVGIFYSSSGKLPVIEKYIGGKFQFDAMPFTGTGTGFAGAVPAANGLVRMHSLPAKEKAAAALTAYMADTAAQALVWSQLGYIPSRPDVIQQLEEESPASSRQKTILESVRSLAVRKPAPGDRDDWARVAEQLEQLELSAEPTGTSAGK